MELINNTKLSFDDIQALPFLGTYENRWRQRFVTLHRLSEDKVISVSDTFDGKRKIVCEETDVDHLRALNAFKYNRKYVAG